MNGGVEDYKELGWNRKVNSSISGQTAGYNSVLSDEARIGEGCYLESSFVHSKASVGSGTILSFLDVHEEQIPGDVVLHGLKQKDGSFVCRIYGVKDNPRKRSSLAVSWRRSVRDLKFRHPPFGMGRSILCGLQSCILSAGPSGRQ